MKRILYALIAAPVLVVVVFFGLGMYSQTGKPPGLANGQLLPCPNKPNCVSSESSPADTHSVAALEWKSALSNEPFLDIRKVLNGMGAEVIFADENYLASTFTSSFFGFVDDVEFRIDPGSSLIHVRSASRVGYSDLGANRARVDKIRDELVKLHQ